MPTILPRDTNDTPIPAVRFKDGTARALTVTATSARNSTAFAADTRVISLYATGPVYIKFGSSSVTATTSDHYFPAGVYYDVAIGGGAVAQYGYIAALRVDTNCTLYISEKE